jgi:hypothetical protein
MSRVASLALAFIVPLPRATGRKAAPFLGLIEPALQRWQSKVPTGSWLRA